MKKSELKEMIKSVINESNSRGDLDKVAQSVAKLYDKTKDGKEAAHDIAYMLIGAWEMTEQADPDSHKDFYKELINRLK